MSTTGLPFSRIVPLSGVSNPASMRSKVVLPQPEGPNMVKNSLARMSKLIDFSA